MSPIAHDIGENALHGVNRGQNDGPDDEKPKVLIGDVIVHDIPRDHGIEHIADGNGERTDEVEQKQAFMGFVVGKKSSYQFHVCSSV